ncbi:MAG TPA: Uma2 family endonuclease [Ktedonobacteraceae bacterium]|jgi:Uma2 family endonuclease|nr:Uma2 family endonuclease [Ktedonobacteraceae bacterium]
MAAFPYRRTISVEEYLDLDRSSIGVRYEYLDGEVRMMAGGTLDHATICLTIATLLRSSLRGRSCRVFPSDARVRISETRYVYPDVTVSCDERDRGQSDIVQSPRLVVEVLSPSTERHDRVKKFRAYQQCPTIQEYVLVNTAYPAVELLRRERNNLWSYHVFGPDDEVELTSLEVRFRVADVYEDITFPPEHDNGSL